jgi:hypothetical protein
MYKMRFPNLHEVLSQPPGETPARREVAGPRSKGDVAKQFRDRTQLQVIDSASPQLLR